MCFPVPFSTDLPGTFPADERYLSSSSCIDKLLMAMKGYLHSMIEVSFVEYFVKTFLLK